MNVLIAIASRHHATVEIAERIADVLRSRGLEVDLVDAEVPHRHDDEDDDAYDAYIVGSAIYLDRWLRSARRFVAANETVLAQHPVWLFSSGPLGEPSRASLDENSSHSLVGTSEVAPVEHHVFGGRLCSEGLGPFERAIAGAIGARAGDFREWEDVEHFARGIADRLGHPTAA